MRDLRAGNVRYRLSGSDCEIALSHALGRAFIELQQLEFTIISYLESLAGVTGMIDDHSFDLFASKTFGNLIREMEKHEFLQPLARNIRGVKEKRDFFIHKFLFHRFGGELTLDSEYEQLIREAADLADLFAVSRTKFDDFMLDKAPLMMFGAKRDAGSGEWIIVESEFSKLSRP
jgi:hypothetical protein